MARLAALRQRWRDLRARVSLVDPIGHELNHSGIDPHFSTHNEPEGGSEYSWRIALEEDARRSLVDMCCDRLRQVLHRKLVADLPLT